MDVGHGLNFWKKLAEHQHCPAPSSPPQFHQLTLGDQLLCDQLPHTPIDKALKL